MDFSGRSTPFQFASFDVNLFRGALIVEKFLTCDQKVAEAHKLPDFWHCARGFTVLYSFEFV
jgi:hypothetical protein